MPTRPLRTLLLGSPVGADEPAVAGLLPSLLLPCGVRAAGAGVVLSAFGVLSEFGVVALMPMPGRVPPPGVPAAAVGPGAGVTDAMPMISGFEFLAVSGWASCFLSRGGSGGKSTRGFVLPATLFCGMSVRPLPLGCVSWATSLLASAPEGGRKPMP